MQEKQDQRGYIINVLDRTGWNQTELAKRAGLDPSTLSRFLSPAQAGQSLRQSTLRRIAQVTGIPFNGDAGNSATSYAGLAEPEAQPLDVTPSSMASDVLAHLRATIPAVDAWTLKSRALELAGYRPGDILFVQLGTPALKGDVVCAQIYDWHAQRTETVFRIFQPPYLVAATADAELLRPYGADEESVVIKGVVLHTLRSR